MKIMIPLLTFMTLALAQARMETPLRSELIPMLPKELRSLDNQAEGNLRKQFRARLLKSTSEALHLAYHAKDNDVTIGLEKGKFAYLYYEAPDSLRSKADRFFAKALDQEGKVLPEEGHAAGRTITINLPKQNLQLKFDNNKILNSVVIWPHGSNLP